MVKIGTVFAKLEKAFTPPPLPSPSTVTKAIEQAFTTPVPLPAPSSITKAVEKATSPVTKELENAVKTLAPKPQQAPTPPPQDQVQQSQDQVQQSQEVQSQDQVQQSQALAIVNSLNFNDPYTLGIIAIIGIIVLYILKKLLFNK